MQDYNPNFNNSQNSQSPQNDPVMQNSYQPMVQSEGGNPLGIIVLIIICVILLASNIYFGMQYLSINGKFSQLSATKTKNAKIISFENLFIGKVLKTQGAVSYQDRLNLQSAVVDINDNTILADWNTFLASSTETDAQQSVLILLQDFTNKIDK